MTDFKIDSKSSLNHLFTKLILISSFSLSSVYGLSLDEVISRAINENPSLESISQRISANRSNILASDQFSNPEIIYTQNTIDDKEAMNQKTVTLKQRLPYFGKRESLREVSKAQEGVLSEDLEQAKVSLVNAIKDQAYLVWELEQIHNTLNEYEEITKQNIELFESYTSSSKNQHMGIMSAELTLSDLRIQKSVLKSKIHTAYMRLSYLASFEIKELDISLAMWDMPREDELKKGLLNNHKIALKEKEVYKKRAVAEAASLNNYPDINLLAGYSKRENFDNFWTFGVGVSLPIYGTEDYKEQEARELVLSAQSLREDMQTEVQSEFESAYSQMRSAYEIYHILEDETLPQIEHMFELANSSIATGGDLFMYTDILIKKLRLKQKSISAVADYNRAEAKISALSGEIQ